MSTYTDFLDYASIQAPEIVEFDSTRDILFEWLKDGVKQFSRLVKSSVGYADLTIAADEATSLPVDVLVLHGLYDTSRRSWLEPTTPLNRDFNSGNPEAYFVNLDEKKVYFSPIPSTQRVLKMAFTRVHGIVAVDQSALTLDSPFPVHELYWEGIIHYLRYRLLLKGEEKGWRDALGLFKSATEAAKTDALAATGVGANNQIAYRDM